VSSAHASVASGAVPPKIMLAARAARNSLSIVLSLRPWCPQAGPASGVSLFRTVHCTSRANLII
jgi:hypothetical protein